MTGIGPGLSAMQRLDCQECLEYAASKPHLLGALASVGISHGLTTKQMLDRYLDDYHQRGGHKEAER